MLPSIKNQINTFLNSYRGDRANKFIAYFQSFSNTYDSLDNLRKKYDTALSTSDKFIGLQIATRPDLINEKIIELIKTYSTKYHVCVELGLQTASDYIGKIVNRGYVTSDFVKACRLLKESDIEVVAHIMVGLPDESEKDIKETVELINSCGCNGVKIHSTYVQSNTQLAEMFENNQYESITMDYYVDKVCKIISNLNSDIIIHRITADPPKDKLIAPEWVKRKKIVLNIINSKLKEFDIMQGDRKKLFEV